MVSPIVLLPNGTPVVTHLESNKYEQTFLQNRFLSQVSLTYRVPRHRHLVAELPPAKAARFRVERVSLTLHVTNRRRVVGGWEGEPRRQRLWNWSRLEGDLNVRIIVQLDHLLVHVDHFTRGACLPFFKRGVTDALHWTPLFKENIVLGPHSL